MGDRQAEDDVALRLRLGSCVASFLEAEESRLASSPRQRESVALAALLLREVYNGQGHQERRTLLDMFAQVSRPPAVRDRQRAWELREAGNAKMRLSHYREAEADYSAAALLDPHEPVHYCNRATARIRLELFDDALADCRSAIRLCPDYAKAFARMGEAHARLGRHRLAAACFRRASELDPEEEAYGRNLEVAEERTRAEDDAGRQTMGPLLQGILGSLLAGGGQPSFVVVSEPHSAEECANREECEEGSAAEDGNRSESGEEGALHVTLLVGYQEDGGDRSAEEVETNAETAVSGHNNDIPRDRTDENSGTPSSTVGEGTTKGDDVSDSHSFRMSDISNFFKNFGIPSYPPADADKSEEKKEKEGEDSGEKKNDSNDKSGEKGQGG